MDKELDNNGTMAENGRAEGKVRKRSGFIKRGKEDQAAQQPEQKRKVLAFDSNANWLSLQFVFLSFL